MSKLNGLMRIGNEPVVRFTQEGTAVLNLALAYNYGKKDSDGKRPTQWIDAAVWGKRAEALSQFLTKGTQHNFYLRDPHLETYDGKNGPATKMVADVEDIELGHNERSSAPQSQPSRAPQQAPKQDQQRSSQGAAPNFNDFDDDIPFNSINKKLSMVM